MPGLRTSPPTSHAGDDRLRDFIPALAVSVRYDRSAGFFSSTMLVRRRRIES
jgi:hypothetical protein